MTLSRGTDAVKEENAVGKDIWTNGERKVEIYKSSYRVGNRNSLLGRSASFKLRGAHFGINDFTSRSAAHSFLTSKGFAKSNG